MLAFFLDDRAVDASKPTSALHEIAAFLRYLCTGNLHRPDTHRQ
jgi:hypothetical protein